MLLILLLASCMQGQPKSCNISEMKPFNVTTAGIQSACKEFLVPEDATHKRALVIMYATGLNIRVSNAADACIATSEKLPPAAYRKTFFENLRK